MDLRKAPAVTSPIEVATDYYDPIVIIGGFMSHFFFTVPLALVVKNRSEAPAARNAFLAAGTRALAD